MVKMPGRLKAGQQFLELPMLVRVQPWQHWRVLLTGTGYCPFKAVMRVRVPHSSLGAVVQWKNARLSIGMSRVRSSPAPHIGLEVVWKTTRLLTEGCGFESRRANEKEGVAPMVEHPVESRTVQVRILPPSRTCWIWCNGSTTACEAVSEGSSPSIHQRSEH